MKFAVARRAIIDTYQTNETFASGCGNCRMAHQVYIQAGTSGLNTLFSYYGSGSSFTALTGGPTLAVRGKNGVYRSNNIKSARTLRKKAGASQGLLV